MSETKRTRVELVGQDDVTRTYQNARDVYVDRGVLRLAFNTPEGITRIYFPLTSVKCWSTTEIQEED